MPKPQHPAGRSEFIRSKPAGPRGQSWLVTRQHILQVSNPIKSVCLYGCDGWWESGLDSSERARKILLHPRKAAGVQITHDTGK